MTGRINDLRHIILKEADEPVTSCINNFAFLMREGALKENIDGESLMWAYKRASLRPEERKIIMVLSDGAPCDDSTTKNMGRGYLETHAQRVAALVRNSKDVELSAIGMRYDASRIYGVKGPLIETLDGMAPIVIDYLQKVLLRTVQPTNDYEAAWRMLQSMVKIGGFNLDLSMVAGAHHDKSMSEIMFKIEDVIGITHSGRW